MPDLLTPEQQREKADKLQEVFAKYDYDDWFIALFSAALDETGDLESALDIAEQAYQENPRNPDGETPDEPGMVKEVLGVDEGDLADFPSGDEPVEGGEPADNASFFADCPRDEHGRCTEGGGSGAGDDVASLTSQVKDSYAKLYGPEGKKLKYLEKVRAEKAHKELVQKLEKAKAAGKKAGGPAPNPTPKAQTPPPVNDPDPAPPPDPRLKPPPPPPKPTAATPEHAKKLIDSVDKLDRAKGGYNLVSLVDLRAAHPELSRDEFDAAIDHGRREGHLSMSNAEGRHGLTKAEMEAGIREDSGGIGGSLLLFVSRRRK